MDNNKYLYDLALMYISNNFDFKNGSPIELLELFKKTYSELQGPIYLESSKCPSVSVDDIKA